MFRVLSIDGGGMRGVYTAAYLDALETAYATRREHCGGLDIGKGFQLIVGTSTGAIIGCGLADEKTPTRILDLYRTHGKTIFWKKLPSRFGPDLLRQLVTRPRYLARGETALRRALEGLFGSTTLSKMSGATWYRFGDSCSGLWNTIGEAGFQDATRCEHQ